MDTEQGETHEKAQVKAQEAQETQDIDAKSEISMGEVVQAVSVLMKPITNWRNSYNLL